LIYRLFKNAEELRTDCGDRAITGEGTGRGEEVIVKIGPFALDSIAFIQNELNPVIQNMKC
jgi:hypothetical protein